MIVETSEKKLLEMRIRDCPFCCIDFETTGLNYQKDEIIEIGAVKSKNFNLEERFETLIRPSKKIPLEITKITGINNDAVMGEPSISDIRSEFLKFLDDCVLVEHSLRLFDLKFLKHHFQPNKVYFYMNNLKLAKNLYPNWRSYKLISVANNLDIDIKDIYHHKAVDDAKVTMLCLVKMLSIFEKMGYYYVSNFYEGGLINVLK